MTDVHDEFDDPRDVELNLDTTATDAEDDALALDLGGEDEAATDEVDLNFDFAPTVEPSEDDLALDLGDDTPVETTPVAAPAEGEDLAPDAEAAMEELRERLRREPGDWYVVHTYSGMENRVKQNLESRAKSLNMEDYIFEVVVPTEMVDEVRGNQKKTVNRNRLPGYVLVRMELTDESWGTVRHTPSVTGFVGHAQNPVPISIEDVERQLAPSVIAKATQAATGKPAKRKVEVADYSVGDSVQVDDGAFTGVHATITEINPQTQRVKVLVEILGRETPIDLTFAQIKKI